MQKSEPAVSHFVSVENVSRHFGAKSARRLPLWSHGRSPLLRAVDGVSLTISAGETFALVGESGCGKSTVARLVVGLQRPTSGRVRFDGIDIHAASRMQLADVRRRVQIIFQDPYASLNPRWRVEDIVAEPLKLYRKELSKAEVKERVAELLSLVHLPPASAGKYPHEFSGGQRQRISIARALSSNPNFIVCDEPTSALDVSVQAQVLNLMSDLKEQFGVSYLFISHNLSVVHHIADRVGVMYLGKLVELAPSKELFKRPAHPYTQLLLNSVPPLTRSQSYGKLISGEMPSPLDVPTGCPFHPRCAHANARCKAERPELRSIAFSPERTASCHALEEGRITIDQWTAGQAL